MTELKKPLIIYMETMLEAGFKEQWNRKGESQTYWVFQFLKEWFTRKRLEIQQQPEQLFRSARTTVIVELLEDLEK